MSWGYNSDYGMPTLRNYAQALAHYHSVQPIRGKGRNAGKRPPGARRDAGWNEMSLAENGDVIFGWGKTNIVIYHPNDTISVGCGQFSTMSTAKYIQAILNEAVVVFDHRLWVLGRGDDFKFPLTPNKYAQIKYYGDKFVVANPDPVCVHHIKRKDANNVRERYSEARDLIRRIFKLREDGSGRVTFEAEEFDATLDTTATPLERPTTWFNPTRYSNECAGLLGSSEQELVFKGVMWILSRAGIPDYRSMKRGNFYMTMRVAEEQALTMLDKVLLTAHRDECFKVVEKPVGSWPRDPNAQYFR